MVKHNISDNSIKSHFKAKGSSFYRLKVKILNI